ncbi:carbohydrate-binding protein, partial [Ruminiclostridium cellobioparum]|uniref:carbohydrate-binding protein n=1 Tax=Ruminiclostridium cellobioparum TaxID=29355 RepID=UPI0035E45F15
MNEPWKNKIRGGLKMTNKRFSFKALSLMVVLAVIISAFCAVIPASAAARGAWAPNTAYATGDTVTYSGSTYTC